MSVKRVVGCAFIALLFAGSAGASSPPPDMEAALFEAAAEVCNAPAGCAVTDFQRQELVPGIVHYSAILQVGPGEFDRIGIHRVVRENRPGHPVKQVDRIFLLHGDAKDFIGMFLPGLYSDHVPVDFGLAVYLAERGVDVWGIDQAWNLVPAETTDFTFMADWGLQHEMDTLREGLAVAREVRYLMHNDRDRFNLLGYSSGAMTGMAYLNEETQVPKKLRHVQAYVHADMDFKPGNPDLQAVFCADAANYGAAYASGQYGQYVGFDFFGFLASTAPYEPSPVFPGFNNLQAALFLGAGPIFGETPVHYLAGEWDASGLPTGLQFMSTEAWLDFMMSAATYQASRHLMDYNSIACDQIDSPFDDHLADINVPFYNWCAAGGIAFDSAYQLTLIGSKDIAETVVSTNPEILIDFGHIDLFAAENAPELAWEPLLEWLRNHR